MRQRYNFLYTLFFMTVFTACSQDDAWIPDEDPGSQRAEVILNLYLSAGDLPSNARAINDESRTDHLTLLAFDNNGGFICQESIGDITIPVSQSKRIYVQLPVSETAVDLVLLANADVPDGITKGTPKRRVLDALAFACGNPEALNSIPMWGECTLPKVSQYVDGRISLLRALAKVEVDASQTVAQFQFLSMKVIGTNDRAKVVPDPVNWDRTDRVVTAPSLPGGVTSSGGIVVPATGSRSVTYVAETFNGTSPGDRISVLIEGNYRNEGVSWYRLDLITNDQQNLKALLRNHKYIFTLQNVNRSGYATEAEALAAVKPDNEAASGTIMVIDQDALMDITTDGLFYLAVNSSDLKITASQGDGSFRFVKLKVFTNNPAGWFILDTDLPQGVTVSRTDGVAGVVTSVWIYVLEGATPSGTIYIQSGNIRKAINFSE